MTRSEAQLVALKLAAQSFAVASDDTLAIDPEKSEERDVGWLLWPQSKRFLETGGFDDELVTARPVFVARDSGVATLIAGDRPTNFEVNGSPGHDFPSGAWLALPLGTILHAAVWAGAWIAVDGVLDWLDRIPVLWALVLAVVLGVAAAWVLAFTLEWAEFANLHRAIPIVMASVGSLAGEAGFWIYFAEGAPLADLLDAQSPSYMLVRIAGLAASIAFASAVGRRDRESQSLWRGD